MKKELKRKLIPGLLGILILLINNQTQAEQDAGYELDKIIISATKTEECQAKIGSSSTVITAGDIEQTGETSVPDILRNIAGISVMQSGPFGGAVYLYLRGSKSGDTLVMIDGIDVSDPVKSDKSFDLAHLNAENIERIEVVRGPQSTLYGSDAMGGVINIITKKGRGRPKWQAKFEGGSHNTFQESLGLSGAKDKLNYSFSLQRLDSGGISKAADGAEKDGYENTTLSTRLGYKVLEDANLDFVFRFADAQYDFDDGAFLDDPNKMGWWRNISGKIAFDQNLKPFWDHKLSFSYSATARKYNDEPDPAHLTDNTHNWFKSNIRKVEWQNNFRPADWSTLTCGVEYEEERGYGDGRSTNNRINRKSLDNQGYYIQNQFKFLDNLFITPGVRIDYYQLFDTEDTYKLSAAYLIPETKTKLKANWGTAFKAPSLYQLYLSNGGNPNLNPNESRSFDFGFSQGLRDNKASFDLTYFHNDFKNMITWDSGYKNVDNVETRGLELSCFLKPAEPLTVKANYTYTETQDKDDNKELDKRPKNQASLNLNWAFLEKGNINFTATYVGHRWNESSNLNRMKQYVKADLYGSYKPLKDLQIFAKIENLFDKQYQEIRGYSTAGRSLYLGCKKEF